MSHQHNVRNQLSVLVLTVMVFATAFGVKVSTVQAQDPCEFDRAKYCPSFRADDPRRLYCLKAIQSQIKPSCKATLGGVRGTDIEFIDDCSDDYQKFCADVEPGKGRILKCLKDHSRELEFECRKKASALPHPK